MNFALYTLSNTTYTPTALSKYEILQFLKHIWHSWKWNGWIWITYYTYARFVNVTKTFTNKDIHLTRSSKCFYEVFIFAHHNNIDSREGETSNVLHVSYIVCHYTFARGGLYHVWILLRFLKLLALNFSQINNIKAYDLSTISMAIPDDN
jgi:hypothetical protein